MVVVRSELLEVAAASRLLDSKLVLHSATHRREKRTILCVISHSALSSVYCHVERATDRADGACRGCSSRPMSRAGLKPWRPVVVRIWCIYAWRRRRRGNVASLLSSSLS